MNNELGNLVITTGVKHDGDKALMHLIPARAEMALAHIREMRREYINQHNLNSRAEKL